MSTHQVPNYLKYFHLGIILATLLASCAMAPKAPAPQYERAAGDYEAAVAPAVEVEETSSKIISDVTDNQIERIVIKNANLSIVVDDPSITLDSISRMTDDMGGFVVSANLYQRELESGVTVSQASITIRVPAEQLNDVLDIIKAYSDQDPLNESIESQDVTREYTDLQSRLRNLEKAEEQLGKIMEEARKTEDVLSVYNELVRVQEQIEVIKGQIQYYEQSAALSAISIELIANEAVQPLTIGGWQPAGIAKNAVQALINAMKFVVNAIIWILIFLIPVLIVISIIFVLPIYLIFKAIRHRRVTKKKREDLPTKKQNENKAEEIP